MAGLAVARRLPRLGGKYVLVRRRPRCLELDRRLPVRHFGSLRGGGHTPWPWRTFTVPYVGTFVVSRTEAKVCDA